MLNLKLVEFGTVAAFFILFDYCVCVYECMPVKVKMCGVQFCHLHVENS